MAEQSIEPGTLVGKRWRIVEPIGEGGFGKVFRATDESSMALGDAAVKVLHPNTSPLERSVFTKEVQRMATLRHQNLVGYLDSGQMEIGDDVHSYLVAEFCTEALDSFVRKQPSGRLTTESLLTVVGDIAAGLAYLHSKQMVHRDIKPANVMFADGAWKLGDFGLTRDLTATGSYHRGESLRGTPLYMSPELFSTMTATAPSDIYAVGVSAHLCAAGTPLHQGSGQALVQNIMSTPVTIDPSLDPAIQDLIYRCTLAEPTQRISATDLNTLVATYKTSPASAPKPLQDHSIGRTQAPIAIQPVDVGASGPVAGVEAVSPTGFVPPVPQAANSLQGHSGQSENYQAQPERTKKSKMPAALAAVVLAAVLVAVLAVAGVFVLAVVRMQPPEPIDVVAQETANDSTNSSPSNSGDGNDARSANTTAASASVPADLTSHVTGGCGDAKGTLGLLTNNHDGPLSYRVNFDHFDAAGVRVDGGLETVRALQPGESSHLNFTSFEESASRCEISSMTAVATPPAEIEQLSNVEISECTKGSFGPSYDITYTVKNPNTFAVDSSVYFALVGDDGVRVDEDFAGDSEYGVSAGQTVRNETGETFWDVDVVSPPSANCVAIAVEFEASL